MAKQSGAAKTVRKSTNAAKPALKAGIKSRGNAKPKKLVKSKASTAKPVARKSARQVKPVRKIAGKSPARAKAKPKKLGKSKASTAKPAARKKVQARKPVKPVKPARKSSSKSPARVKTKPKKLSKVSKYPFRILFISVLIAGATGFAYGRQMWTNGYVNALNAKQTAAAPGRITTAGPAQTSPNFSKYPTWSQNFATDSSDMPDSRYWNIYKGAPKNDNKEAQYYTDNRTNIHIKDGALSLVATHQKQPGNHNYASARVDTEKKLAFLYGRIDVTAKLPNGVGTWPAVWFLPANTKYRDLSPPSDGFRHLNGGEIDLIEEVGFNPNIEYGVVHTRSDQKNHPDGLGSFDQVEIPNNEVQYNTYSLLWTPASITLAVNNVPFFIYDKPVGSDYTTWSFDQPFYMIINLALGGVWGGEDTEHFPGNGIDNSALPASMDIKSIYYYPYRNPSK